MNFPTTRQVRWLIKPVWFLACLAPFVWLTLAVFGLAGLSLGADPIEETQDFIGIWALRLLLVTLALTPLRLLTGQVWLIQLRRMTGLYVLFYVSIHFLNYLIPDQGLDLGAITEDIVERSFITLGIAALTCLIVLGITSTHGWRRRLGRRWQKLHRLVYAIGILACTHFWWQVKLDTLEPTIYAGILAVLLGVRVYFRLIKNRKAQQS
ncbi:MAG: protein-methionine-sulfoxide reductase heme-binding subunit MsrQ [Gammaproteobacteria bacterium]|jgi:sulfoxide reductase heme-binding subunit YedZ|nr:protein-methionine-sulfoxide reductase heme-binding subunit MsrQ [Gammaproteobacteria bacterium]MDP6616227.1 protein-methionine-sulfoxide reductase heme-binding subunit MsrQ [Gammaproteobacteria bacterium]MDP6695565.1 protein-methionine-sulfoxide reductase heme-binding subunit MsrQ [Gammaproteobacteria bacterium]